MKITKKYVTRTDVKMAGFSNLYFYGNAETKKVYLDADLEIEVGKIKYKIPFTVEAEKQATSHRNIEKLCRLILEEYISFSEMKQAEKKRIAEEKGEKILV